MVFSVPSATDLAIVARDDSGAFRCIALNVFENINMNALEYAACVSADQLELFFTRLEAAGPAVYRSTRPNRSEVWETLRRIASIAAFVEAPAFSPDERLLCYHVQRRSRFVIERVERSLH